MTLPLSPLGEKSWPVPAAPAPAPHAAPQLPAASFSHLLGRLGTELDRGERLVKAAASGPGVADAGALIALQAGIYRYTETVDLAAKLVDGATNALRTTLSSGH